MTYTERDERIREALCEDSTIDLAEQLALIGRMALRERGLSALGTEGETALAERQWECPNCLRDFNEPYCDECGANLMEVTR